VLSPGIISTLAAVTKDPTVLLITLGFAKPSKKNSAVVTFDYALHRIHQVLEISMTQELT